MDDYIPKPIRTKELLEMLQKVGVATEAKEESTAPAKN